MKVSQLMTRDVEIASPGETLEHAAKIMATLDAGVLPVSENDRLVGMITDRDIAVRGIANGRGPDTSVRELMSGNVICAKVGDNVDDVAAKMSEAQVRRLPVVDEDDRLCGIVSLGDLSREASGDQATEALEGVSAPGDQHRQ